MPPMSDPSSRLDIRLLGPVEITLDGTLLAVDTRKAIALLAYLVVERRPHSREHLGDLFWPDADPSRARATLRRTLSTLRTALSDRWVAADRTSVRLVEDAAVRIDVDVFRARAGERHGHGQEAVCGRCVVSLGSAATEIRGEFMQGFGLRDAPAFDDWMMASGEVFRREASAVFERLAAALAGEGRYGEAISAVHRWLEIDPLHERAHRTAMLLHAWSGDRAGAVDAYRNCVAVLGRELGVEPLEETTELHEAILEDDLPRAPAPVRRPTVHAAPATERPLVGRVDELSRLRRLADAGRGVVVVEAPSGMGKTRLLEEFAGIASGDGHTVLQTGGHPSTQGVPYGPVQALLAGILGRSGPGARLRSLPPSIRAEVARLVPALGEPGPVDPSDPLGRSRFLDALAEAVEAAGDRIVLLVDDVHFADEATLEFLGYLATRHPKHGLVVVLALRPEDLGADGTMGEHIERLTADAVRLTLGPLTPEAVGLLVGEATTAEEVHRRTGGVPFFVVEHLEALAGGRSGPSDAVQRLLADRLGSVGPVARQLLAAVAVIGMPAEVDLVRGVSGRSEEEVVDGLDELLSRRLVRERPDGSVAFEHDLLRDAAYDGITLARRRLLHRRVAEQLMARREAASDPRAVAAAASHQRAAGNDAEASRLSARAGELSIDLFAPADAVTHLETALALDHPDRAGLSTRLGAARTLTGAYGSALRAFETARAELHVAGREDDAARLGHAVGDIYRRLQRWDAAAASFAEAWDATSGDPAALARLAADWAFVEHRRGNGRHARDLTAAALQAAEASGDGDAVAHAHNLLALLADDPVERRRRLEEGLASATSPATRATVLNNLARTAADAGDLETAVGHAHEALALVEASGDRHRTAALYDNLADFLHRAGDEHGSMEALKQAVTLFADVGTEPGALEPAVWRLKEW